MFLVIVLVPNRHEIEFFKNKKEKVLKVLGILLVGLLVHQLHLDPR